jgi:ABC-type antimicrobial peptide transport system permease subunit
MLSDLTAQPRLIATVGNTLATIALLLAMIGVYGLLSYSVARRTSEFGLRMALGADPLKVMGLVLRRALTVTVLGIALGLVAAAFITRFIQRMLFGVTPLDPVTFIVAGVTFLLLSALATFVPVRRAIAVSPVIALRAE